MANNNIVLNVTVNGLSAMECVKKVQSRMDSNQKSAFNIAVLSAYATGVSIPAFHDFGEASIDKKMSRKAFLTLVDRSKATISRWIGALQLVIDNNDFVYYAEGVLPFQYDKIYLIYNNLKAFEGFEKSELFKMSLSDLEAMLPSSEGGEDNQDMVTFVYEGITYSVAKKSMDALLKKASEITVNE